MNSTADKEGYKKHFFLEKWFLDFVTEEGEVYIFYAAQMKWHHITIPYKSMLTFSSAAGKKQKVRFYNVRLPVNYGKIINWKDNGFKVEGAWQANTTPIAAQLFESGEGKLQWSCFQPSSIVKVKINDAELSGMGYAEQLTLSIEPWKIPMDMLRWGRFVSNDNSIVWIEIKGNYSKQWLWHNGDKIDNAEITDEQIIVPSKNIHLVMNKKELIESEKIISKVVRRILRFLPGFNRTVPLHFLAADEYKWISRAEFYKDGLLESEGWVINERVDFKR